MNQSGIHAVDSHKSSYVKQEGMNYQYDNSFINYSNNASNATSLNQPLPGQPPLPPMPPPQAAVPPPPSVYTPVPTQVAHLHAWPHTPTWQWISPQASAIAPHPSTDLSAAYQKDSLRITYSRRDRYNCNRNNVYQRGHYRRNRKAQRYEQAQNQYDQASYYNAAVTNSLKWQLTMTNQLSHMAAAAIPNTRTLEESKEQDVKEEVVVVKKNKQRKPMSQSYSTRAWNQKDAEKALEVEKKYSKAARSQSLIIKFPDPDINKSIVSQFHPGIRNIHFQSPSGPRYCFVQMEENVDIDEAIKSLEKIEFGLGHLKVERKSMKDEENPTPEDIDPYTLYIGNLPESISINEVKNKFPPAARIDVGFAQKMRNTRYAFIRYNTVEDSIAAYKQAHNLMWETRSIIVRFLRHKGNNCLPGESKPKKLKNEPKPAVTDGKENKQQLEIQKEVPTLLNNNLLLKKPIINTDSTKVDSSTSKLSASDTSTVLLVEKSQNSSESGICLQEDDSMILPEIKVEPLEYVENPQELLSGNSEISEDNDENKDTSDSDFDNAHSHNRLEPFIEESELNAAYIFGTSNDGFGEINFAHELPEEMYMEQEESEDES